MSQRNPMNERYQSDEHKGKTRKSAAAAKPKTKAASSVRVVSATKTPEQKKAEKKQQQKVERQKQRDLEAKYYNPPTEEYKRWRRIWWVMLILAIVMVASSFLTRWLWPDNEVVSMVVLGIGYVSIFGALAIDFVKIRKIRRNYQAEMATKDSKEERRREKEERAAQLAAKKAAEAAAAEKAESGEIENESPIERKKGLFSFSNLRGGAQRASENNKARAKESQKSDDDSDETEGK